MSRNQFLPVYIIQLAAWHYLLNHSPQAMKPEATEKVGQRIIGLSGHTVYVLAILTYLHCKINILALPFMALVH